MGILMRRNDRGYLVPSGVYFYQMRLRARSEVRRTVLIR
jgi:hypothetical protein